MDTTTTIQQQQVKHNQDQTDLKDHKVQKDQTEEYISTNKTNNTQHFDKDIPILFPFAQILILCRTLIRNYLYSQVEWTTLNILPIVHKLRGSKAWDIFFTIASLCGEEEFYMLAIPIALWNTAPTSLWPRGFVCVFTIGLLIGDLLKNLFALPRPPLRFLLNSSEYDDNALDNRDFGWPSTHSLNSVAVPFFLIHHYFGGVWLWNSLNPIATMAAHVAGLIWCASISVSRLYLGVHSPADVQGGMILGGILLKLYFFVGDDLLLSLLTSTSNVFSWSLLAAFFFLLILPRPSKPFVNYTYLEVVTLAGFLQGFLTGSWLRWGSETVVTYGATNLILRNLVGFVFFGLSYVIVKKLLTTVCRFLLGWLSESQILANKIVDPRKIVVKKDLSYDVDKISARFILYSYLGVMVTYLVPTVIDQLALW